MFRSKKRTISVSVSKKFHSWLQAFLDSYFSSIIPLLKTGQSEGG